MDVSKVIDPTVGDPLPVSHPVVPETRSLMLKADLRKTEMDSWRESIGRAIERVQERSGLSLKEFADAVDRDERQVSRWFAGIEHAQLAAILAVPVLRQLLLVALAELIGESVEIETHIRIRRRA